MTDRELKKLSRTQLLEMLLAQSREVTRLREELAQAQVQLSSRQIQVTESGNLAEAALKLSGVFEAAQTAADQYLQNITALSESTRQRCLAMETETRQKCEEMTRAAEAASARFWDSIREKIRDPFLDNESWQDILRILDQQPGDPDKVRK